jgi:hypothetical protein
MKNGRAVFFRVRRNILHHSLSKIKDLVAYRISLPPLNVRTPHMDFSYTLRDTIVLGAPCSLANSWIPRPETTALRGLGRCGELYGNAMTKAIK